MGAGDSAAPTPRIARLVRFTTRVVNHITRLFAGRLPGFGILSYVGRRSGRRYRAPVNVFRDGPDYVIALTYGSRAQWVQNVLAAGTCELRVRGHDLALVDPVLFVDPNRHLMPTPVRQFLGLMRVSEFLRMSPDPRRPGS